MEVKTPNQISHDSWYKERGHSTAFTLPIPDLIASRLIRYDPTDQADIQFMLVHQPVSIEAISQAVTRLPAAFREDALVQENLKNLQRDLPRWLP